MHEEILYPVCPHRNVPAAFERFLGPDSGGIERFFPDERPRRADGTLVIVRLRGRRALASARHEVQRAARAASQAVSAFNSVLSAQFHDVWLPSAVIRGRDAAVLIGRCATLLFGSRLARLPA